MPRAHCPQLRHPYQPTRRPISAPGHAGLSSLRMTVSGASAPPGSPSLRSLPRQLLQLRHLHVDVNSRQADGLCDLPLVMSLPLESVHLTMNIPRYHAIGADALVPHSPLPARACRVSSVTVDGSPLRSCELAVRVAGVEWGGMSHERSVCVKPSGAARLVAGRKSLP
jgi:hypothetical protein